MRTEATAVRIGGALVLMAALCPAAHARRDAGPLEIVVIKRAGILAYQEATEEFIESCRVRARIVNLGSAPPVLHRHEVVLAVGQRALDAVAGSGAQVVSALALKVPPGVITADVQPSPELTLRALRTARPAVKRVAVVYGPRTEALVAQLAEPAAALGITLVPVRASDGPEALRRLNAVAMSVDALWLAPDIDVVVPQVFQYALGLEIARAVPIVGVSRQQVRSGALLAVDADPRAVGRQAALLVNELLGGVPANVLLGRPRTGALELVVNGEVARRLGADLAALRAIGAKVE